jgi:hypothetical protein
LGASKAQEPQCIICSLDRVFTDKKAQGPYTIQLALEIARNGTVTKAVAKDAPTPEVKSHVEQQLHEWIFEPYLKDGAGVSVKLNTSVRVNIIRSR